MRKGQLIDSSSELIGDQFLSLRYSPYARDVSVKGLYFEINQEKTLISGGNHNFYKKQCVDIGTLEL